MSELLNFPAVEIVTSKDDLRPVLSYVLVTKEKFVATDSYIMIWHKTSDYFEEDFINKIPEDGILIHREDWAKIKKCSCIEWKGDYIEISYSKKRKAIIKVEYNSKANSEGLYNYPNFEAVIPKEKDFETCTAAFNPELLFKAKKAINYGQSNLALHFTGKNKGILIREVSTDEDEPVEFNGLLMPVVYNYTPMVTPELTEEQAN